MLKKQLICDYSRIASETIVCNLTDLQPYYNRQLPNFASIIEELVEIKKNPIYLFTKVLLIFKHFTCTGYRISEEFCSGPNNLIGGTE